MDQETSAERDGAHGQAKKNELLKRVLSAIVLGGAAIALTVWSPLSFIILVGIGAAIMCWEWRMLIGSYDKGGYSRLALTIHIAAVLIAILLMMDAQYAEAFYALCLGAVLIAILPGIHHRPLSFAGPFYTGLPAIALVWLRMDPKYGLQTILFIFLVVWTADIAAFVVGRTIGGPKLSPAISPNKTWSGMIGGLAGSMAVAALFAAYIQNTSLIILPIVALLLAFGSQVGDLTESALKRKFKIKDSSRIIPGHGGILDRVDGLIVAALLAALLAFLITPAHPGHAILIWQ